jgi:5-(carboxyamino)imidazole ribonucleotide synthase
MSAAVSPLTRPIRAVGILGGGQLGQMLAIEAKQRGYTTVIRTDDAPGGPASQVADVEIAAPYCDAAANSIFATQVDVVTAEFENLPADLLARLEQGQPVRPSSLAITTCQHRATEKQFLADNGIAHAPFELVTTEHEARRAHDHLGSNTVMKTAAFGYDGRGQIRLRADDDAAKAFEALGGGPVVLEQWITFEREISVVGARGVDGQWAAFPPGENVHVNGILDYTIAPARVPAETAVASQAVARKVAEELDYVGTIGVEMFVMPDGSLVVNEIAPRPHNSGHHTIEACATSQFGQQLLSVTGQALGDPTQHTPAVMVNLLGDLWANGEPDWSLVATIDSAFLHLYGKHGPRPGRKMGHLTVLAPTVEEAMASALSLRTQLRESRR